MTYTNGTERWAGRVYDGPLEGEHRSEDRPFFEFNHSPRSVIAFSFSAAPSVDYCYRLLYRWSNPLRAWVFDWRSWPIAKEARRTW